MENPQSWNLLTSSLAVSNLEDPSTTWAFLVVQGLVHDRADDRATFGRIVRDVLNEGPITGPSEASRVSMRLVQAGLNLPAGTLTDASGKLAHERAQVIASWRNGLNAPSSDPHP